MSTAEVGLTDPGAIVVDATAIILQEVDAGRRIIQHHFTSLIKYPVSPASTRPHDELRLILGNVPHEHKARGHLNPDTLRLYQRPGAMRVLRQFPELPDEI